MIWDRYNEKEEYVCITLGKYIYKQVSKQFVYVLLYLILKNL